MIVGLFHDIGKVGMPGKPYYLPEIKDGKPNGAYSINPELVDMGLSLRSLYLVSRYIPLSNSEAQAIDYHDGMYVPEGVHSNLNTFTLHYPFAFKYANQHGIQVNDLILDQSKCLKGWPKAESVRVISKSIRR